jgi:hypothetical protein
MADDPNQSDRTVSQASFHDVLAFQLELRNMIRDDIGRLSGQLADVGDKITDRQDVANGRVLTTEKTVAALVTEVGTVKSTVEKISKDGCSQKVKHAQELATLMIRQGVVPVGDLGDDPSPFPFGWTKQQTVRRVGIGGGLVGIGVLLPDIFRGLHWLAAHFVYAEQIVK